MTDLITVQESVADSLHQHKGRWLVTVARPGQGSMGFYSEQVLKETGPEAFPPGTLAFFTHDSKRDPRDQVGTYPEGAFWNEEDGELQAYLEPYDRYRIVLNEAGKNIGVSIHSRVSKDNRTGTVRELLYHRGNTIDLVGIPGLEGSNLKYQIESLREDPEGFVQEGKEENMEQKDIDAIAAATAAVVAEKFQAQFDIFVEESRKELQAQVDNDAVAEGIAAGVEEALAELAEKEKAVDDAKLPAKVAESLKARARKGEDISEAITDAKEIVNEALAEVQPAKGRGSAKIAVVSESMTEDLTPKTYRVGRWSN